jgi:chorismate dehydratase
MSKIKISCVSYLNSQPFVYGLKSSKDIHNLIDLSLDVPSICADKLINNEVDIGLIPVAALANMDQYEIISDYCIGANKKVLSVLLLSDYPLKEINNILLDDHSRTSNNLTKILAKHYWKTKPTYFNEKPINPSFLGKVSIGDKAFIEKNDYKYAYDLAEEWYNFKIKTLHTK